jgi:hypothetical protein
MAQFCLLARGLLPPVNGKVGDDAGHQFKVHLHMVGLGILARSAWDFGNTAGLQAKRPHALMFTTSYPVIMML